MNLKLTNNQFRFNVNGSYSAYYPLNVWYHFVVTDVFSNTNYRMYINGTLTTAVGTTYGGIGSSNPSYSTPSYIFYNLDGSTTSQQNMFLKNYRLWNTYQDPIYLYNNKDTVFTSNVNLIAQYTFNNTLNDSSGNNVSLTWSGEPTSLSYNYGYLELFHLDAQNLASITKNIYAM